MIVMLTGKDFVAGAYDKITHLRVQPAACMVHVGGGLLQNGVRSAHFARNDVLADAEKLRRTLGLCAPQLIGRYSHFAETIAFDAKFGLDRFLVALLTFDHHPLSNSDRARGVEPFRASFGAVHDRMAAIETECR
jgi:hypothetical protein